MKAFIPTLTSSGFVKDLDEGGSQLLSYFVTSDGFQSTEYNGHVHSLPNIIALVGHNALALETSVKSALEKLYNAYYDSATVAVNVTTLEGESDILIDVKFTDKGFVKDLNRSLQVSKNSIITILGNDNG